MISLVDIALHDFVTNGVKEVFSTMLSMKINQLEPPPDVVFTGEKVISSVGFGGKAQGVVHLYFSKELALLVTTAMLGVKPEELNMDGEVKDVLGEMGNMVVGGVKSHLCDAGLTCQLTVPSITRGAEFQIDCKDPLIHQRFVFDCLSHRLLVELRVKPGE
ncbi:MAG: chemotaxis protein CheX [Verrucomicrobiae bacterium]|nr:chemotaxis protein CheX [Verrucomicrobiae bacterium]